WREPLLLGQEGPGFQIVLEPVEGLAAQARPAGVVEAGGILALAAAGQGGDAGGVVAVARAQLGRGGQGAGGPGGASRGRPRKGGGWQGGQGGPVPAARRDCGAGRCRRAARAGGGTDRSDAHTP